MTELAKLYYQFWSTIPDGNGGYLPAYVENSVPVEAQLPYVTYTLIETDYAVNTMHQARIWAQGTDFDALVRFCEEVHKKIPTSGVALELGDNQGVLAMFRGSPFIQNQPTDEINLKVAYINVEIKGFIY